VERSAVDRAVAKLERAAGAAAERAAAVRVEVDGDAVADIASTIRRALDEKRRLHLSYWVPGRDETTERDVDPMRLALADGRLYLEGWCHRAESVRLFRLDRVAEVSLLEMPAEVPAQARSRDLSAGIFQPSPDDRLVTMELEPAGRWVADYFPCETVEEIGSDRLQISLRVADPRWIRRLCLRLGGTGRIVDPADLARAVVDDAVAALKAYAQDVQAVSAG
jgi:proteasome accessory factor C